MAQAIPFIALALTAVSTAVTVSGALNQGQQQAQSYDNQAQAATTSNALNTQAIDAQAQQAEGKAIAALGASGADPDSGSGVGDQTMTAASYAREIYSDDFATNNQVQSLYDSSQNALTNADTTAAGALFNGGSKIAQSGALQSLFTGSTNPSTELNAANPDGLLAAQGTGVDAGGFT